VNKFQDFLKNSANWQLRAVLAAITLVITVLAAAVYSPAATLIIFIGVYAVTTGPDWRNILFNGGFSAMMPIPNVNQMRTIVAQAANSPRTNTQRKRDAKRNKRK